MLKNDPAATYEYAYRNADGTQQLGGGWYSVGIAGEIFLRREKQKIEKYMKTSFGRQNFLKTLHP